MNLPKVLGNQWFQTPAHFGETSRFETARGRRGMDGWPTLAFKMC
jgi:hypothetical protein